jgi:hypothetical protein
MPVLAPMCIHNHEIILFHNILMTILLITYIYFSCLCLTCMFLSNLSKSLLLTFLVCFQFGVHDHRAFKLNHMMHTTSDLDVLHMHGKLKR